ncbi:uncharacterized protein TNCV_3874131 [Trichonephila clavipes]|nr:uncharacterized protein TNCV_3874131 [Trichonephila clavipes]
MKIHDLVLVHRRLKVHKIAEIIHSLDSSIAEIVVKVVKISKDRVVHILQEILGMRKLLARWVQLLFSPDNKRNHVTISEQCLVLFKRNLKECLRHYVTYDETGIHWYTTETKEQSKQ